MGDISNRQYQTIAPRQFIFMCILCHLWQKRTNWAGERPSAFLKTREK